MYYFIIETLTTKTTIKNKNIKELKKIYNDYLNSYNYLSISAIKKGH